MKQALIIGNNYKGEGKKKELGSCHNDADAVTQRLRELGWTTELIKEANKRQMLKSFRTFFRRGPENAKRVIYFSGHGQQLGNSTYLIPVGATVEKADDELELQHEYVAVSEFTKPLCEKPGQHVLILDCCRHDEKDRHFKAKGGSDEHSKSFKDIQSNDVPDFQERDAEFFMMLGT